MNRFFLSGLVLLVVSVAPLLRASGNQESAEVNWRTNYAAARQEANAAGKPLFVVFRCER
jgi:hypothetical protein